MSRTVPKWVKDAKYHFCAVCGRTDDLQYHHWEPNNGHNTVPENIIVLCARHHQELHGQGGAIMHNYLVKEGIAKAKEAGVHVGKPPADYEKVMRMIAENSTQFNAGSMMTEHEIMDMAGVKEVCYAKCKRMLIDEMESGEWPYEWSKPTLMRKRPLYDRVIKRMRGEARGCV